MFLVPAKRHFPRKQHTSAKVYRDEGSQKPPCPILFPLDSLVWWLSAADQNPSPLTCVFDLCLLLMAVGKSQSLFQYRALAEARVSFWASFYVVFYWMLLWTRTCRYIVCVLQRCSQNEAIRVLRNRIRVRLPKFDSTTC
jgi:hypothetical protein